MEKQRTGKFTLGATGDILLHTRLYNTAKKTFGFDFNTKLSSAKHLLNETDYTLVNLESIIAGTEIGLSSFPAFNSPVEIGYLLKDYGVDMVNIANNHVLDRGKNGLLKSIANLEAIGMPYIGAFKSENDQETLRIETINGLKVCFLSYTRSAGTAHPKTLEGNSYLVNTYHPMRTKAIKDLIKHIRNKRLADVIILSIHFGKEYHLNPTSEQKEVSIDLSDAGADIIIGHHPHVLQPPEYILNSRGKKTFCAYSLGNFFTGQFGLYRQIGAFMSVEIEKKDPNSTNLNVKNPTYKLTFVDSTDKKDFKLSLLKDIVNEREYIKTDSGTFNAKQVYHDVIKHLKKNIPDLDVT